ncbi:hypothetical protein CXB51_019657 [Gossypium anomalum]|uniref:Aminotransferase-like plant mobile domain-containing protein n=1 Tax=Gossypium anomalum TaxID=47600 RepID=A0A8J5YTQ7_9ROSI|nr:hypothetical protein CXB51_019657 [Gossypium anomalum]
MGSVSLSIFTPSTSYVGIPTTLEDIRLLLDQRLEVHFQWTLYEDQTIRAVIPDEFFQNLNIWHVKVSLINYATVEMHQTDRVFRQFGFRQPIPVTPEVLDEEHKIDLRQTNMHWSPFFSEYIEMWENRYDHIPTRELIIVPKLTCTPDYMLWFRIHGKSYLLSKEQRRRAHTITEPNASSDNAHTTAPSDYARCISWPLYVS